MGPLYHAVLHQHLALGVGGRVYRAGWGRWGGLEREGKVVWWVWLGVAVVLFVASLSGMFEHSLEAEN